MKKSQKLLLFICSIWIVLISVSLFWNYTQEVRKQEKTALETGKSFFKLILITRLWNARHGGVYVPVTEELLPNPYLDIPMRDIDINENLTLTRVNPAFMTRQLSDIAREKGGIQFHLTSLNPIRPQNRATAREEKYLKAFEKGVKEVAISTEEGSADYFFYMAPLKTEKACLQCHARQGYREGDIRGGISITLPFAMEASFFSLVAGHLLIGAAGLLGIIFLLVRLDSAYKTIERQALMDVMTEIPNHRNFLETISREIKRSHRSRLPLSIIMCDIDNFKSYNDTYGHSSGDVCLRKVAQQIAKTLKRSGDFCARYGGEEFIVILPDTSMEGAIHVAERIRLNIEQMGIDHENSLPLKAVTLSLGISTSEGSSLFSRDELIRDADTALYNAKRNGRNRVEQFSKI